MPLDTRITIRIEALGDRDSTGEYQPGATTSFPVWADEMKSSEDDHLETGGGANHIREALSGSPFSGAGGGECRLGLFGRFSRFGMEC